MIRIYCVKLHLFSIKLKKKEPGKPTGSLSLKAEPLEVMILRLALLILTGILTGSRITQKTNFCVFLGGGFLG